MLGTDIALILLSLCAVFGVYALMACLVLWCLRGKLTVAVRLRGDTSAEEALSLAAAAERCNGGRGEEGVPVLLDAPDQEMENALRAEGLCVYVRRPTPSDGTERR